MNPSQAKSSRAEPKLDEVRQAEPRQAEPTAQPNLLPFGVNDIKDFFLCFAMDTIYATVVIAGLYFGMWENVF